MSRRRAPGATLVELLISMSVFLLLLGLIFLLFGISSRGFQTIERRQLAQNQLAAIRASVQSVLQVSHFYGIYPETNNTFLVDGVAQPRHALSAVGLSRWDQPGCVDELGIPVWDQWVVFRVTAEEKGQLLRHTVSPGTDRGRLLLRPAEGLSSLALSAQTFNPVWGGVGPPQILARGVRSLQVALNQEQRAVEMQVTIEQRPDPKNPKPDVITAVFFVKPHNTVPAD